METGKEGLHIMDSDYFADELLTKLDTTEVIFAAYEAQDISREVGFDFDDFQDVVPRALDEIRETKEALEEGDAGREHFGDEIADIMFSMINLARHAGISRLPELDEIVGRLDSKIDSMSDGESKDLIDAIGARIEKLRDLHTQGSNSFTAEMSKSFVESIEAASLLAKSHSFEPEELLRENVRKYLLRCQAIERLAAKDGKQWADLAANGEIVAYWKRAKEQSE